MNIAEEIQKLQQLRDSGTLTDAEFAAAKARVLQGQNAMVNDVQAAVTASANVLKKFTRSRTDCMVGGICGALGQISPLPSWIWRILFVVLFFTFGIGLIPYLVLWILVPEEESPPAK